MFSTWDSKNPLLFGAGTSKEVGARFKAFGSTKVLVVFDQGVKNAGIVDPILKLLEAEGIKYCIYDKVLADPPDYSCNEAGDLAKAEKCDGVLAIGGGSSMDTAKAARVLLKYPGVINDYFMTPGDPPLDESGMVPIIVIPTTSGTGSEASPGAVITDTVNNMKAILNSSIDLGIVDPELTVGLPPAITAMTGIDAFCHAAEALTSSWPNAIAAVLTKESCRLVAKYLPIAVADGKNMEARTAMSLAATLGTSGMRGPLGHMPHTFGMGLSKNWHTAHGVTVGLFMAITLKKQADFVPDQVRAVCEAFGKDVPANATPAEIGQIAYDAMNDLLKTVNFPKFSSICTKEELLSKVDDCWHGPDFFSPYKIETKEQALEFMSEAYDAH